MLPVGFVARRLFSGVSSSSLERFYFQLSTMLASGVAIREALRTLAEQGGGRLEAILRSVAAEVEEGLTLSESMARRPEIFDALAVALVAIAERTGRLDQNLELIAESMERRRKIRSKMLTRLIYPILLLHLAIIIPNALILIQDGFLPFLLQTALVLLPIYVVGAGLFVAHQLFRETRPYSGFLLALFFFGPIIRKLAFARFSRALAALYDAGVPLAQAVETAAEAVGDGAIRDPLKAASLRLQQGAGLREAMEGVPHLPPLVRDMMSTGEQTGSLEVTLRKVADYYEHEAEQSAMRLAVVVPLLVYLVIVSVIAWKVITFWTNYYSPYFQ